MSYIMEYDEWRVKEWKSKDIFFIFLIWVHRGILLRYWLLIGRWIIGCDWGIRQFWYWILTGGLVDLRRGQSGKYWGWFIFETIWWHQHFDFLIIVNRRVCGSRWVGSFYRIVLHFRFLNFVSVENNTRRNYFRHS